METRTISELNNTYLQIENIEGKMVEDYRYKMLTENSIKGILPFEVRTINGEKSLFIDISGRENMNSRYAERSIDRAELRKLFENIYLTVKNLNSYLFTERDICFIPEYVFYNASKGEFEFISLPIIEGIEHYGSMKEFLQFLIANLDSEDELLNETMITVFEMYNGGNPNFSLAFEFFDEKLCERRDISYEETFDEEDEENLNFIRKSIYIPTLKEIGAISMCIIGGFLIGANLYLSWLNLPG